jgi:YVTN family beta-propeller protein
VSSKRLLSIAVLVLIPLVVACNASAGEPTPATGGPAATPTPTPDPQAKILATVPVSGNPGGMIEAYGSIWVASRHTDSVVRIDPATNAQTSVITAGTEPAYLVDDGQAVWVVDFGVRSMVRIDPKTNAATKLTLASDAYGGPIAGGGAVWQVTGDGLAQVDTAQRTVAKVWAIDGPAGPAFAGGFLWLAKPTTGIQRLDPRTMKVKDTVAPSVDATGNVIADRQWVWAGGGTTETQLDAATGAVIATYQVPRGTDLGMTTASGGRFWFQQAYPDSFASIDGTTKTISPWQDLPGPVTESLYVLGTGPHEAYVTDWDADAMYKVDPLP